VEGEVIHALLGLLDERVAEQFPSEILRAPDLLQRLVDRHRAHRHRRVAQDPLARFVDMLAGGKIHDGVATPARGPDHLLDLRRDRRSHGRVADVGVDLGAEVAADDHRLEFGVIDVGRDDGPPARDLVAHEFRRDHLRQTRAKGFARMALVQIEIGDGLAAGVFADGDVLHLGRHHAAAGVVHLGHAGAVARAPRCRQGREAHARELRIGRAAAPVRRAGLGQGFRVASLGDPVLADGCQTLGQVDVGVGIRVDAGRVIDRQRRIGPRALRGVGVGQGDLAQRHAHIGPGTGNVDPARSRKRLGCFLRQAFGRGGDIGSGSAHGFLLVDRRRNRSADMRIHPPRSPDLPSAGGHAPRAAGSGSKGLSQPAAMRVPPGPLITTLAHGRNRDKYAVVQMKSG